MESDFKTPIPNLHEKRKYIAKKYKFNREFLVGQGSADQEQIWQNSLRRA
jgi:hypothetical protein